MRLWDKGAALNAQIHRFTVGHDPLTDRALVPFDALGSAAHAHVLKEIGILSADELSKLLTELQQIYILGEKGKFAIAEEMEDCHTAIEARLTEKLGDIGRKIHTGRSRNDQVLVTMRLVLRNALFSLSSLLLSFADAALARSTEIGHLPLAGYTHFQPAMPANVAMWLQAQVEAAISLTEDLERTRASIDSSPLGVGSGFGVPLDLKRSLSARLLGFSAPQRNPIHVQNSRGREELKIVRATSDIAAMLEKLACDLMLYTTREFGFFSLPEAFTTGSSIMPQKRNPDVIELLRGSAAKVRACEDELRWLTAKLPSSYHRDFQMTKEPTLRAVHEAELLLSISCEVLRAITPHEERLRQAMVPELYATYDVYRGVREGMPFRDAYQKTAKEIAAGTWTATSSQRDFAIIEKQLLAEREEAAAALTTLRAHLDKEQARVTDCERRIFTVACA